LPKNKQEQAIKEFQQGIKDNGYLFYEPCGKASEFIHRLATEEDKMIWLFIGGNASSKTASSINILANLCFPSKNKYFNYPLFKNWPYLKRARFVTKAEILKQKTIPEIQKWFPKGRYKMYSRGKTYISEIITDTGWKINLMTFDQDPEDFEGADLGLIMADEPPPEKIWDTFIPRLREGGKLIATFTPIGNAAYLYNRYIRKRKMEKGNPIVGFEHISVWDNVEGVGVRGYLKKEYVEQIISEYAEYERESRIEGKFSFLSGLIYGDLYNPKIHELVWEEDCIPDDWTRIEAIDWHPNKEWAVSFIAISPYNVYYTYDEIWANGSYEHIANLILQKRKGKHPKITLIDPSAGTFYQGAVDIPTVSLMKASNGLIKPVLGSKERDAGIRLFRDKMKIDEKGTAGWYIYADRCPRTLLELNSFQMKDGKILKENDDMMENHHRILLAGFKYSDPRRKTRENLKSKGKFY